MIEEQPRMINLQLDRRFLASSLLVIILIMVLLVYSNLAVARLLLDENNTSPKPLCQDDNIDCLAVEHSLPSTVFSETANWRQIISATAPPQRDSSDLVFDSERNVSILFGGRENDLYNFLDDTWELYGDLWISRTPATFPSARATHVMAYDILRKRTVMFAGFDGSWPDNTWEWDENEWLDVSPSENSPSGRTSSALAYDSTRSVSVLFGGFGAQPMNDTWEWNGTTWSHKTPQSPPPARHTHAMAYDSTHGKVILFGGAGNNGRLNDTWVWDGNDWAQLSPSTPPPHRDNHSLANDTARGRIILFGGMGEDGKLNDTWEWDGSNWIERIVPTTPPARSGHMSAYDSFYNRVIVFGGADNTSTLNDTWAYESLRIEATPASSAVPPGKTTNFEINVEGTMALTNLIVTGLPTALEWEFSPSAWITPTAEVNLVITTTSDIDDGSYAFSVTAASDNLTTTLPLTLTIAAPDFNLQPEPPSWFIHAGTQTIAGIVITATDTFTALVGLELINVPSGIDAYIVTNPANPGTTVPVSLTASLNTNPGVHILTIFGSSILPINVNGNPITKTTPVTLTILPAYTPTPTSTPTHTATNTPTPSHTPTNTATPTPTATASNTPLPTSTLTPTASPSFTPTPLTPSKILLPFVIRQLPPTPTPTPTPTPIPTSTPFYGLINGDFEMGPTGWYQYSSNNFPLILHSDDLPVPPRSGVWASWLGGWPNEASIIFQEIAVPTTQPTLYYWHWIASQDICGPDYDIGGVLIDEEAVDAFYLCQATNTNGWVRRTIDLSPYAGQHVTLYIAAFTDATLNSNLFIDDVSLGIPLLSEQTVTIQDSIDIVFSTKSELSEELSENLYPILNEMVRSKLQDALE